MSRFSLLRQKLFAAGALGALLFSLVPTFASAAADLPPAEYNDPVLTDYSTYDNPFPDTDLTTLEGKAAAELFRRGVLNGRADGEFHGESFINRAEILKMLLTAKALDLPEGETRYFPDVLPGAWYYDFITRAARAGIVNGYPNGTFHPENPVNTVEFLKMFTLSFGLPKNLVFNFRDVPANEWFAPYAGIAEFYKLFPRRTSLLFPASPLTRSEVAVALYQYFLNRSPDSEPPVEDTPLTLEMKKLDDATYSAASGSVVVFQGTITAKELQTLEFVKLGFDNLGTATLADVASFSLSLEGADTHVSSAVVPTREGNAIVFDKPFADTVRPEVSSEKTLDVILKATFSPTLSAENATLQMELTLAEFEVKDTNGVFLTIARTSENKASRTVTLTTGTVPAPSGEGVLLDTYSATPPSRILIAGSKDNIVSAFRLKSTLEPAEINKLTLQIQNIGTNDVFDGDVPNDADAIENLKLLYPDGTAVLTKSGTAALISAISADGKAVFSNLDITIARNQELAIFVSADIAKIGSGSPAKSGMAFSAGLSLVAGGSDARGGTSGANIPISSLANVTPPNKTETMYVLTDRVIAEKAELSDTLDSGTQQDLIRFKLTKSQTLSHDFLRELRVTLALTGNVEVENLALYGNNSPEAIAFARRPSGEGDYHLIMGVEDEDGNGTNDEDSAQDQGVTFGTSSLIALPNGSNRFYDEINSSQVYTLRGDVVTDGHDDRIATTIKINADGPNIDGVVWRDDGGDSGNSGVNIQWINLDISAKDTSRLEQILRN